MRIKNTELRCENGDITKVKTDVIVNAANSSLLGGGGVDGAIHRTGGPLILDECRKIVDKQGSCPVGEAVITTGGKLPAKFVIHTVGPVWSYGKNNEEEKLRKCYRNSLKIAEDKQLESIAFSNKLLNNFTINYFEGSFSKSINSSVLDSRLRTTESTREIR